MKDYTSYDYQALVDRMTEILADKPGWGDAYQSSTGQTLIQLMADVTDYLHYMLERRTLENFLDTARLRTSIITRASELGYRVQRDTGHSGFLTLEIIDDIGDPRPVEGEVVIDALSVINFGSRTFYTTTPTYISEGATSVTLKVIEGALTSQVFDYDATGEVLFADYSNIEDSILFVYNGTEEYPDVRAQSNVNKRALSFLDGTEAFYDIKYGTDGMRIEFGDNVFGKKPSGDVTVEYATVDTTQDPILSLGNEFEFENDITDFQDPSITYKYTLTNTSVVAGGGEVETDEEIVSNATAYHRSNGRAVTNDDYAYWLTKAGIGDIVDSKAFGEEEFDSLVYNANNVYLTYATETGSALTTAELNGLIDFFDQVKTSQAHVVFNQANNIMLRLDADVVTTKTVPISNAQAYNIVYNFILNYLKIGPGSIGGTFQVSDMVRAMYDLKYTRAGVDYPVVDYVKISTDVVTPFTFPGKTSECFVEIDPSYEPTTGDEFVLILENLVCKTDITDTENFQDILTNMRDVVREITPFDAVVQLSGVALDAFGNPLPIEINPKVGYNLLIGVDTPYLSNDQLVAPAVVGSAVIGVVISSPELDIKHYYYSSPAGRRPMIPLRIGTIIDFTAPTDTDVKVYKRTNAKDATTESFVTTIPAGDNYNETFTEDHVVIFEYVNDSVQDVTVDIHYPNFTGVKYGLRIKALDNFGTFSVQTTSGDLADVVTVDYRVNMPVPDFFDSNTDSAMLAGSVRLADSTGIVIYKDDGEGNFVDAITGALIASGTVDYNNAQVTLPKTLPSVTPANSYQLMYDQDRFENLTVGSSDVIKLINPPPTLDSTVVSQSTLKIT